MKTKIEEHHHWHLDIMLRELFIGVMILITVLTMIRIIDDASSRNEDMYKECLDACTKKPTSWNQNPQIINYGYDRVECVRVCNSFHYSLTRTTQTR